MYYRLHQSEGNKSIPASVFFKGEKVLTFTQTAGGVTPRERASLLVNKLNDFIKAEGDPNKIFPGYKNGVAVGTYENEILFTADVKSAKTMDTTVSRLAFHWTNNIRKALGAKELLKDYNLLKAIADNTESSGDYREVGMASWYGGCFHGRRSADGSRFNMNEFTAAHKSLPFGSIVRVTNLRNKESCVVKITDRGPFVQGRIIDLSKVAAEEIGMLGSGTSKVQIEVIGKV